MDKNSILQNQITLLEEISNIMKKQMDDIEIRGREEIATNEIEEFKRAELLVTKRLYLKFFNDIVIFLLSKLKTEIDCNFKFYLPNCRTLHDIYGQLLYLNNQDTDKQTAICIANRLYTVSFFKGIYDDQYKNYKPFLDEKNIYITSDNTKFSKKAIKILGFNFPPVEEMLKEKYIRHYYPELKNTEEMSKSLYIVYKHLCNYVHGNILCATPYKIGREKLWLISIIIVLSGLMAKIVDTMVLEQNRKDEIAVWMVKVQKAKPEFTKFANST